MAPNTLNIDPIKYLTKLPTFDGNFKELYTFLDLVDRISPLLDTYDDTAKAIFLDIIKSKLCGSAKEISNINNHLKTWASLKTVLVNNFGDRLSLEQLYDQMRSLRFKSNAKNFYDEIVFLLSRLNMKARTVYQNQTGYESIIAANKRTALEVFKNKLIEPMRSIIICRNPNNIEDAIKILFDTSYAYYNPNPNTNINKNSNKNGNQNRNKNTYQNSNQNTNHHSDKNHQKNSNESWTPNTNYTYQNQQTNGVNNQNHTANLPQSYNQNQLDYDRPVPMEIGNFRQTTSENSPT